MGEDANPGDDPQDAAALAAYAGALADAVVAALPRWVERAVALRYRGWCGEELPAAVDAESRAAGQAAVADVEAPLRDLLAQDPDAQRANPLAIVRRAVVRPTEVLRAAGVPPVPRDPQAAQLFPDDDYDLSPGAFADLDPSLHEPGLVWGAAKAHVILARRRAEGRR
ncbi:MAG: hypothetical protein ACJ739_12225 [Acidimicrobiales bacterium]